MMRTTPAIVLLTVAALLPHATRLGAAQQDGPQREELVQVFYDLVDRDPFVQRPAARYLRQRGARDALPFMIVAMRYDPFRHVSKDQATVGALRAQAAGVDLSPRSHGGLPPNTGKGIVTAGQVARQLATTMMTPE